jgi:hypothetical protein
MVFGLFERAKTGPKMDAAKWSHEALIHTSLHDLLAYISAAPKTVPANALVSITQRLIEIIYEDETISDEERERAKRTVSSVIDATEAGFENNPEALAAYRNAYKFQIEQKRKFGIGSLGRKIANMPSEKVISELIKPEYVPLLPDLKESITGHRAEYIKSLIRDRVPAKEPFMGDFDNWLFQKIKYGNAVNTAGWLVLIGDPTAILLFNENERKALAGYLTDYESARLTLVEGGIISISRPLGFTPIPDPIMVHQFMLRSSADRNTTEVAQSVGALSSEPRTASGAAC